MEASTSRYGQFDDNGVYRILMGVRDYELDQFGELLKPQAGMVVPYAAMQPSPGDYRGSSEAVMAAMQLLQTA